MRSTPADDEMLGRWMESLRKWLNEVIGWWKNHLMKWPIEKMASCVVTGCWNC
jgi:hypothetical protein